MIYYAALILFPALMAFAAASDLVTMTISNKVSLALIAGFLIVAAAGGMPPERIGWHLLSGLAVLGVTVRCSRLVSSAAAMPSSLRRPPSGPGSPIFLITCWWRPCLAAG